MQLFYNMSDPGMEDMLCEVESVRRFTGVRLSGPIPDETTILNFRHLLERHGLGRGLFEEINAHLAGRGYRVRRGTIVDATIIAAPSSTHSVRTTPANTHDLREAGSLLHGGEEEVWADSGYRGIERWVEAGGRDVRWTVAMAPGRRAPPGSGGSAVAAGAGEGLGACQGGAPVPLPEASLRLPGGSLPGAGEEHRADRAASRLRPSHLCDTTLETPDGGVRNVRSTGTAWLCATREVRITPAERSPCGGGHYLASPR